MTDFEKLESDLMKKYGLAGEEEASAISDFQKLENDLTEKYGLNGSGTIPQGQTVTQQPSKTANIFDTLRSTAEKTVSTVTEKNARFSQKYQGRNFSELTSAMNATQDAYEKKWLSDAAQQDLKAAQDEYNALTKKTQMLGPSTPEWQEASRRQAEIYQQYGDALYGDSAKMDFFQAGALGEIDLKKRFRNGYQFGDFLQTVSDTLLSTGKAALGTVGDAALEVGRGALNLGEGVADALSYGVADVADLFGANNYAEGVRSRAQKNLVNDFLQPADEALEKASVLGSTSDAIANSAGQMAGLLGIGQLGTIAGLGSKGVTALTTGTTFASGYGSGVSEAYQAGATDSQARAYGAISGAADTLTEMLFAGFGKAGKAVGLNKSGTGLDDWAAKKVSNLFKNEIVKEWAEAGVKSGFEGLEEVLAGAAQAIGKKATYMSEEEFSQILADEKLLEQFVVGFFTSGVTQAAQLTQSRKPTQTAQEAPQSPQTAAPTAADPTPTPAADPAQQSQPVPQESPVQPETESIPTDPLSELIDQTLQRTQPGYQPSPAVNPAQNNPAALGKAQVSHIAQTAKEAPSATGEIADLIDTAKKNGDLSYYQIPNSVATQKATEYITRKGWEQARMDWMVEVRSGRVSAETTAIGALLLNNAAKAGDKKAYLEILKDFQAMGTNAAQATQAVRILKQLSPDSRLYMIQRSIGDLVEAARLPEAITIPDDLSKQYIEAETEGDRDQVISRIQQYVADQLPSSLIEKFNALRYVNMLGNFKTQGRNILGNLGMQIVSELQNAICTGLEAIANKATGGKYQRTRSLLVGSDLYKAARADFAEVQALAMGGGKYENKSVDSFTKGVQDRKAIFRGIFKPLEAYRRATNWAMEAGDEVFSKHSYARALAGYLKANGITAEQFSKMEDSEKDAARAFAVKEAQEKTFRDSNRISNWISKVGRRPDTPLPVRIMAEGEAPFRKTSANIGVRAWEYSPLGAINTIVAGAKAMSGKSEVTAQDFLNSASKNLTGSGIFLLGMMLKSLGFLNGAPDDDEKQAGFDDAIGIQPYSLQLPGGASYTLDWAAPLAIPLFMGAEMQKLIDKKDIELEDVENAMLSLSAPLVSMTMLQTVDNFSASMMYSDGNWGEVFLSMANDYLTQGLANNLLGQLENSAQGEATTTYVDPESGIPEWIQRSLGSISRKVPGWDYQQVPYRNDLGETEDSGSLLYNLLSPGYLDQTEITAGQKERQRLANALGDTSVLYSTPSKNVSVNGSEYTLSAQAYDKLKDLQGKLAESIVDNMLSSSAYTQLPDDQKAKAIKDAYKYATEKSRQEVVPGSDGFSYAWMEKAESDPAAVILDRYLQQSTGMSDPQYEKAKEAGFTTDSMAYVNSLLTGLTPETGHSRVTLAQKAEAIAGSEEFTSEEKEDWLHWLFDDSHDKKMDTAKDLGLSAEEYAVAYKLYSIETDTGGKGTNDRIVSGLMEEFDIDEKTAESLYKVYSGSYKN